MANPRDRVADDEFPAATRGGLADTGYVNRAAFEKLEDEDLDLYVAMSREDRRRYDYPPETRFPRNARSTVASNPTLSRDCLVDPQRLSSSFSVNRIRLGGLEVR